MRYLKPILRSRQPGSPSGSTRIAGLFCVSAVLASVYLINHVRPGSVHAVPSGGCSFDSAQTGDWSAASTWTAAGICDHNVPGAIDDVIICNPHEVTLDHATSCTELIVEAGATLTINGGEELTLLGAATIEGTIDGAGATAGTLSGSTASSEVTVATGDNFVGELTGNLILEVLLVDNGLVVARAGDTITLTDDGAKSGSGEWRADGGTLVVGTTVEGDATWRVAGQAGKIRIDTDQVFGDLTGDMLVSGGALICNETFVTCGDLEFTGGEIQVAGGNRATFGGNTPGD